MKRKQPLAAPAAVWVVIEQPFEKWEAWQPSEHTRIHDESGFFVRKSQATREAAKLRAKFMFEEDVSDFELSGYEGLEDALEQLPPELSDEGAFDEAARKARWEAAFAAGFPEPYSTGFLERRA